ncbi:hypothetical protein AQI95_01750 [Streptomyces yokosukanensis]|uniref:Uncharacterized protein n=1 Tax=Streptomyces yokosukanensis TaxID=67386 RepID=A0A124HHK7_9ACTN|nr:hypothetical protein [Streptomyces yokosukanensis]KUN10467.1 hypothetical protein AQI95_01750 [Streptomyces yokosukanensis]
MDYCSSCRRHLNGALVCPGCGAYAPDIAPPGTHGSRPEPSSLFADQGPTAPHTSHASHADQGWFATASPSAPAADGWFDTGNPHSEVSTASPAEFADASPVDVTDAPSAPRGRAARRRQMARWKKNQRRAVVATAVALVGGGLTLASMDRGSGGRAQAATAPDNRSMGLTEDPSTAPSRPASTATPPATAHRHTPAAPTARTTVANVPHQQTLAATPRPAVPHTDSATVASHPTASTAPAAAATPQPRSTAPASSSGTAAQPTPSTGGTTSTGADTGTGSTGGGSSASAPASASTSPTQLCLVLICLG